MILGFSSNILLFAYFTNFKQRLRTYPCLSSFLGLQIKFHFGEEGGGADILLMSLSYYCEILYFIAFIVFNLNIAI